MRTGISWLDVRLGARMLIKHPGLTLIGGLGMAVAIAVSVGFFAFFQSAAFPTLPLDEGERIVALENRDAEVNNEERRSLHDFLAWREELKSVEDLAAFRNLGRDLVTGDGPPELVKVAEMTAAGFRVARVPPLLGRYLVEDDEREGAPPVVVIGHDVWQARFAGDPGIVGRQVWLSGTAHTVVGVMPEDFAFPVSHQFWTPLRANPAAYARREGPSIYIFGRLAPGVSMHEAQAELEAIGRRMAAAFPETHAQLRPMVMPYVHSLTDIQGITLWQVSQMQLMVSLLLVVVALNVAVLVYARTATRRGEIAVRSALGASRRRVVGQLFVEALVLSAVAALLGLGLGQFGMRQGNLIMEQEMSGLPFWTDYGLRPSVVVFAVGLAVLAAVIVGIVPALQATGRRLQADLRQLGGGTGMRLGKTWTVLIVAQVAIAVAALPAAVHMGWSEIRGVITRPRYPAEEFLEVGLGLEVEPPAGADAAAFESEAGARFGDRLTELLQRVEAEPGVAGATFTASLPDRGYRVRIEVEGVPAPVESPSGHDVIADGVGPGYFALFGARVLEGRDLASADAGEGATPVVVNRSFVHSVLDGGSAVGRRLRFVSSEKDAEPGPWHEIVGVVENLKENPIDPDLVQPGLAYPVAPGQVRWASLAVRLRGADPTAFAGRLREIAISLDPALRLGTVQSLAGLERQGQIALRLVAVALSLILLSVFLLSAAGIYAMMSFTVTQRHREIGIRSALGAPPGQVLRSVFSRAAMQIGLGLVVGVAAAALLDGASDGGLLGGRGALLLPIFAGLMLVVGLLAAFGPARRGLRIEPTEALRAEG